MRYEITKFVDLMVTLFTHDFFACTLKHSAVFPVTIPERLYKNDGYNNCNLIT